MRTIITEVAMPVVLLALNLGLPMYAVAYLPH